MKMGPCYWSSANGTDALLTLIEEECSSFSCTDEVSKDCTAWEPMREGGADNILSNVDCDAIDTIAEEEKEILGEEMKAARGEKKEACASIAGVEREERKTKSASNKDNVLGCA